MKRQGLLSVTGIVLLGLIVLMTLHEWDNPLDENQQAFLSAPMIVAGNVIAKTFNADTGEVQYHLTADHLEQYDHDPLTLLDKPVLTMDNKDGAWTIQSLHGEVRNNGDLIVFQNKVEARNERRGLTLNTNELQYFGDAQRVLAPTDVDIRQTQGSTRAGKMEVQLDSGEMTLSEGVVSDFKGTR
ncbi:LPS export ABC transporter periplasmic protein LptC [Alloalcanivorax mobilis]|uniref:LPS export ABC transporter periplasmic protein LptC n=1 Tax=Alloalcanivorax mobilis TaxID=2019569 RepID=UPI000C785471|nr:LPS export ABC transporter periplasmic protein LptC [Alloalcanivorax mobilis]